MMRTDDCSYQLWQQNKLHSLTCRLCGEGPCLHRMLVQTSRTKKPATDEAAGKSGE